MEVIDFYTHIYNQVIGMNIIVLEFDIRKHGSKISRYFVSKKACIRVNLMQDRANVPERWGRPSPVPK